MECCACASRCVQATDALHEGPARQAIRTIEHATTLRLGRPLCPDLFIPSKKSGEEQAKKKKDASTSTRCVLDLLDARRTCEQLAAVAESQRPAGRARKKAAGCRPLCIAFLTAASFRVVCAAEARSIELWGHHYFIQQAAHRRRSGHGSEEEKRTIERQQDIRRVLKCPRAWQESTTRRFR